MSKRKNTNKEDSNKKSKNNFELVWKVEDTLHYLTSKQIKNSDKILSFDMDHTLVSPKSKGKFPTNR
jgi:hypothetical protein